MILPAKHLREERALLTIGAELLEALREPKTVSRLWSEFSEEKAKSAHPVTYDWFILALDLLFTLGTIEVERGRLFRVHG